MLHGSGQGVARTVLEELSVLPASAFRDSDVTFPIHLGPMVEKELLCTNS